MVIFHLYQRKKWSCSNFSHYSLKKETVDNILTALSGLSVQDYTDVQDQNMLGLLTPTHSLKVTLKDGTVHTISSSAKPSSVIDGFYIAIDENKPYSAIDNASYHKLFPEYTDLFELSFATFTDISKITVLQGDNTFSLQRGDADWLVVSETENKADKDAVTRLIAKLNNLHIQNMFFHRKVLLEKEEVAKLTVDSTEGTTVINVFENDNSYYLDNNSVVDGVFEVDFETGNVLLQKVSNYVSTESDTENATEPGTENATESGK